MMGSRVIKKLLVLLAFAVSGGASWAQPQEVAVEVWADRDQVTAVDMSPNAERIAMLMRRSQAGDPELLLFDADNLSGSLQAIAVEEGLTPTNVFWANDRYLIVSMIVELSQTGRPVYLPRVLSFDVEEQSWRSMVRIGGRDIRSNASNMMAQLGVGRVQSQLIDDPDHILVAHTEERGQSPNLYRTNVATGARELVFRGNSRFDDLIVDRQGEVRGATEYDAAANRVITLARTGADDDWREIGALDAANRDRFGLLGFYDPDRPNTALILADEPGENTVGIYEQDITSGDRELLFRTPDYDAVSAILSPRASDGSRVVGYRYADLEGIQQYYIDQEFGALYAGLSDAFPGRSVQIVRYSEDGGTVLLYTSGPQDPGTWYLLRDGRVARLIGRNADLPADALSPSYLVEYEARDGMPMSGYVTVPDGEGPHPLIAMPHGGPWVRDYLGYDRWAQMLANRGWAVFQPNYRGSRMLGKAHWIAGDRQWGLSMQDDVEDGVQALIQEGIADPEKLGFFGWSYGGYSAFAAATRPNSQFNCIAAGAGVADIRRIRGGLSGSRFLREFQQPTIDGVNPIELVDRVERPMFIVHGDYDTTVPVEHSRRWVSGAEAAGVDISYVEIEDMGHSPRTFEDNMQWMPELFEFFETKCGF